MAKQTRAERRQAHARQELAGKGWAALAIGALLLTVAPALLKGPLFVGVAPFFRPGGWIALAIGVLLLSLHHFVTRPTAPPVAARIEPHHGVEPLPSSPPRHSMASPSGLASVESSTPAAAPVKAQQWSPAVLATIEWRRFEALCEALYAQAGFTTRSQTHGADGGIDIWLQSKHSDVPRIVQCKHWQSKPVGVKEMREFFGVMASHQLKSGTYVTSSTFTADALAFAKANGIHAQDGAALLRLIAQRTPEQQAALLAVAYEGEYWRPTCASCGTKMIERTSSKKDGSFWGCANYPKCRGKAIPKARA